MTRTAIRPSVAGAEFEHAAGLSQNPGTIDFAEGLPCQASYPLIVLPGIGCKLRVHHARPLTREQACRHKLKGHVAKLAKPFERGPAP